MIFKGHGAARLVTVSSSIARKISTAWNDKAESDADKCQHRFTLTELINFSHPASGYSSGHLIKYPILFGNMSQASDTRAALRKSCHHSLSR